MLFLIYINDLDGAVNVSGTLLKKKFADDTKLAMVVEIDDDHARLTI